MTATRSLSLLDLGGWNMRRTSCPPMTWRRKRGRAEQLKAWPVLRKKRIVSMKDEEGAAAAAAAGSPHGLRLLSPRKSVGRALRGRAAAARPQHDLRAAQMRSLARAAAVCREKEATPPAGELHWQGGQHISLRICFHILLGADKLLSQH